MNNYYSEQGNLYDKFNRIISPQQLLRFNGQIQNPNPIPLQNSIQRLNPVLKAKATFNDLIPSPPQDVRELGEMRPTGAIFNDQNSFTEPGPPSQDFINNLTNHLNQFPEDLPSILEDYGAKDEMPPNILQEPAHDYFNNIPLKPWNQYQGGSNRAPEMYIPTMQEMTPLFQPPTLGTLNQLIQQGRQ